MFPIPPNWIGGVFPVLVVAVFPVLVVAVAAPVPDGGGFCVSSLYFLVLPAAPSRSPLEVFCYSYLMEGKSWSFYLG